MTPTDTADTIARLRAAVAEVYATHRQKAVTTDGRLDLLRAQRDALENLGAICNPSAIAALLSLLDAREREIAEKSQVIAELLDQMHHFANADQRLWDESQRDPESFKSWVRSRAAHLLKKFNTKEN